MDRPIGEAGHMAEGFRLWGRTSCFAALDAVTEGPQRMGW